MDMIHTDFARALLGLRHRDEVQITFSQNSLVYDGRNNWPRPPSAAASTGRSGSIPT